VQVGYGNPGRGWLDYNLPPAQRFQRLRNIVMDQGPRTVANDDIADTVAFDDIANLEDLAAFEEVEAGLSFGGPELMAIGAAGYGMYKLGRAAKRGFDMMRASRTHSLGAPPHFALQSRIPTLGQCYSPIW
jgi:hypothetical protein